MLGFLRGGHPSSSSPVSPTGEITTFQVVNTETTTTSGYKRVGMPFAMGDVPVGSRIKIQRGTTDIPAQFDNRSTWLPDGSLKFCTASFRDSDFLASETRNYSIVVESGAFNNTSSVGISAVTAASSFVMEYTGITTCVDAAGNYNGTEPNQTAALNTHALTATRVTKYESGPICDSWEVWGMAVSGSTPHPHLKTVWYVTRWKTAAGALFAHEVCAVSAQDWWAVPTKKNLRYTAVFKNGVTTLDNYGVVDHIYGAWWASVRQTFDLQHARRHWVGTGSRPSLIYKPNRAYWVESKLVPPHDLTKTYTMPTNLTTGNTQEGRANPGTFKPGSAQGHRAGIDSPGFYPGRGALLPNMDAIAFVTQTPQNVRTAIVHNHVGLHFPIHHRSERMRTRPGDGGVQDSANTIMPFIMKDQRGDATPSSYYTFTADGMPASTSAFCNVNGFHDGYVQRTARHQSGQTLWLFGNSGNVMNYYSAYGPAHAVSYSHFGYLLEGERYFFQATLGNMIYTLHQQSPNTNGAHVRNVGCTAGGAVLYPGTPTQEWNSIACRNRNSPRAIGFVTQQLGCASLIPDNDVQAGFVKAFIGHQAAYWAYQEQFNPADGNGMSTPEETGSTGAWMYFPCACGLNAVLGMTGDERWRWPAEYHSMVAINLAVLSKIAVSSGFWGHTRINHAADWSPTNTWLTPHYETANTTGNITSGSSLFTGVRIRSAVPYSVNDRVRFPFGGVSGFNVTTNYWIVEANADGSFRLSATQGGTPITATATASGVRPSFLCAAHGDTARYGKPLYSKDDYAHMARAVVEYAKHNGHPDVTSTVRSRYDNYVLPSSATGDHAVWDLQAPS